MPIISVLLVLILIGVILWLVNTYIPMEPAIKAVIRVVVLIVVILWLLGLFFPGLSNLRVGR
jgi:hypothetical protein